MTKPVRRAGRLALADGGIVLWSLAEGRNGRRWRWNRVGPTGLVEAGLLEIATGGSFARLELATPSGLLTIHPEAGEGRAHGNVVSDQGVTPIRVAWTADHDIGVAGSPVPRLAVAHALRGGVGVGETSARTTVTVDARLALAERRETWTRIGDGRWVVRDTDDPARAEQIVTVDAEGLPPWIESSEPSWALETSADRGS
ncbi:MAG: hypothetical protein AABZ33_13515 [Chloroflexota bacterium]